MPLTSQVKEMQDQGLNEDEIAGKLAEQGISPLEISNALEQAKIKSAVSSQQQDYMAEEMQPSLIEQPQQQEQITAEQPTPQPIEEQYAYPSQAYQEYQPYQPYQTTEAYTEIAEQIAEEKTLKLKKSLSSLEEFKNIAGKKIELIEEKLKRIESIIDKLQLAILNKIGSYGENLESIKGEMEMMQDSFSKALPGFVKKERKEAETTHEKHEGKKRKSSAIEHYLRR